MGALILAFTPHSVYAAPYHRDNHGNRMIVDAFLAKPATAEQILRSAKADLLIWRQTGRKASPLAERAPAGLAACFRAAPFRTGSNLWAKKRVPSMFSP